MLILRGILVVLLAVPLATAGCAAGSLGRVGARAEGGYFRPEISAKFRVDDNGLVGTEIDLEAVADIPANRLLDMGLNSTGVLTVKTDARIISSNANKERNRRDGKRGKEFIWNITSILNPKPVLTIDFR